MDPRVLLGVTLVCGMLAIVLGDPTPTTECEMEVKYRGDKNFEDISWEITFSDGEYLVGSSGWCGNKELVMMLNKSDTFEVTVTDEYGSGLCCGDDGDGYLEILIDGKSVVKVDQFDKSASAEFSCASTAPVKITKDHSYYQPYNCLQPFEEEGVCGFTITTDIDEDNNLGWYIVETDDYDEFISNHLDGLPSTEFAWNIQPYTTETYACTFTEGKKYSLVMEQMYDTYRELPSDEMLNPIENLILKIGDVKVAEFAEIVAVRASVHNITCDTISLEYSDLEFVEIPHIPSGETEDVCRFSEIIEESCLVDISFISSTPSNEWTGELYVYNEETDEDNHLIYSFNNTDVSCYLPIMEKGTSYSFQLENDDGLLLAEGEYLIIKVDEELLINFTSVDSWAEVEFECSGSGGEVTSYEQNYYPEEEEDDDEEAVVLYECSMPGEPTEGYCSVVVEISTNSSYEDWNTHWMVINDDDDSTEMVSYFTNSSVECGVAAGGAYQFLLSSDDGLSPYMNHGDSLTVTVNDTVLKVYTRDDMKNTKFLSRFDFDCAAESISSDKGSDSTSCTYTNSSLEDMCQISVITSTNRTIEDWMTYWRISSTMFNQDLNIDNLTCLAPESETMTFSVGNTGDMVPLYENESIALYINGVEMYVFSDVQEYSYLTFTCDTVNLGDEDVWTNSDELIDHLYCDREEPGLDYCNITMVMNSSSPDTWDTIIAYLGYSSGNLKFITQDYVESYTCTLRRDEEAILYLLGDLFFGTTHALEGDERLTVLIDGKEIAVLRDIAGTAYAEFGCETETIQPEDIFIATPSLYGGDGAWCNSHATGEGFCDVTMELSSDRVDAAWKTIWEIVVDEFGVMSSGSNLQESQTCSLYSDRNYTFYLGSTRDAFPPLFGDESLTLKVGGVEIYTFTDVFGTVSLDIACGMSAITAEDLYSLDDDEFEEDQAPHCSYYTCRNEGNDERTCSPEDWQCEAVVTFSDIEGDDGVSWEISQLESVNVLDSLTTSVDGEARVTLENDLEYSLKLTNDSSSGISGTVKVEIGDNIFDIDLSEYSGWLSMEVEFTCDNIADIGIENVVSDDTTAESDSSSKNAQSSLVVAALLVLMCY